MPSAAVPLIRRSPYQKWHLAAAAAAGAGAGMTVAGVCLPWVTYYGGLFGLSAVGTTNGTRLLVAAGAAAVLAVVLALRPRPLIAVAAGSLGGIVLLFSVYLASRLRSDLSGADAMVVARQGLGLYFVMGGGTLMLLTAFVPQLGWRNGLAPDGSEAAGAPPGRRQRASLSERLATRAGTVSARRALQLALGMLWLVDAALQAQPYMFSHEFATSTLMGAAAGSPHPVAASAGAVARLVAAHPVFWNELFAATQLAIAVLILRTRSVRVGLIASAVWGTGVWAFGESFGQLLTPHATPLSGAPGAAIFYSVISILLWTPGRGTPEADGTASSLSVAETSAIGVKGARTAWLFVLGLATFELWPEAPTARSLAATLHAMRSGEPAWLARVDARAALVAAHDGMAVLSVAALLFGLCGLAVLRDRWRRPGVVLLLFLAAALWLLQDFGGIATGMATDVDSAPLLALFGLCYWPGTARAPRVPLQQAKDGREVPVPAPASLSRSAPAASAPA